MVSRWPRSSIRAKTGTTAPDLVTPAATYLSNAGVPIWIDDVPAITHNKAIILDDRTVITGSFNFTRNADERNAENVVFLDSPEVAARFTANWEARRAASHAFGPAE